LRGLRELMAIGLFGIGALVWERDIFGEGSKQKRHLT